MRVSPSLVHKLTAPLRALPDFLIIGAQKCGTSSLHAQLALHPEVRAPLTKEVHYFDIKYHRGPQWYRAHFPIKDRLHAAGGWKTFESSVCYLYWDFVPERIVSLLPDVRLIAVLRDPVERAYSQYQMSWRRNAETLSFEEAIAIEEERLAPEQARMSREPRFHSRVARQQSYVSRGRYAEQIERWLRYVPRERLLVLDSRELAAERQRVHAEILSFLGITPATIPDTEDRNVGEYEPMAPRTREQLSEYFAPHNQRLYELLGRDFGW